MNKILEKGNKLLEQHKKIGIELRKIPFEREIFLRYDDKEGKIIAKPRFKEGKYTWKTDKLQILLDHLQNIWDYLEKFHYYFDGKVLSFINKDTRRSSKHSIILLLERDVWFTDDVYGDYLIEIQNDNTVISYYRREEKRKTFTLKNVNDLYVENWIIEDARNQILKSFNYKWDLLYTEIDTCANGLHIRIPKKPISDDELRQQVLNIGAIMENSPIAALLSLGRVAELWCIISLVQTEKYRGQHIIQDMKRSGLISDHEGRLLNSIRINYNSVKHKANYEVNKEEINNLYNNFCELIGI